MLGMGNNMHLWPEKQAWDTTPNRKRRNGWSSITVGTSSKGMGIPKYGGMHDKKPTMHACVWKQRPQGPCTMCTSPQATPHKAKVKAWDPPLPQESKNAAHFSLSLLIFNGQPSPLSLALPQVAKLAKRDQDHSPPSLMQNQLFFCLFLQIIKKRRMIYTLASSDWPISPT